MPTEDEPESPITQATVKEAQRTVQHMASALQTLGWDAIVISVSRAVKISDDEFEAPGATATVIDTRRCGPIMPQIVEVLRKQANMLEARTSPEDRAVGESSPGYIQDATDYASGCARWPE